ncbi:MAG: hypothetical protein ACLPND_25860 [Candidatus Korobacteraceae bacterium]
MEFQNHILMSRAGVRFGCQRRAYAGRLAVVCLLLVLALPLCGQTVLYDNGPDAEVGYYRINFAATTIDSFELSAEATLSDATLTIYDVDDRNVPKYVTWIITTAPAGGTVLGRGLVGLSRLQDPYLTKFLFFAWKVSFQIPKLTLPPGKYYLQLQNVVTQWGTQAFWAVSSGPSSACHAEVGPSEDSAGQLVPVASESFAVLGEWTARER